MKVLAGRDQDIDDLQAMRIRHADVIQITGRSYRLRNQAGGTERKKTVSQACKDGGVE